MSAKTIKRIGCGPRMSQAVVHGDTVYVAGQVALAAGGAPVAEQTRAILATIDALLAENGTDKSRLLQASIWLSDMADFKAFNDVWDAWVVPGATPARAAVEARLAAPQFTVEVAVIAALD